MKSRTLPKSGFSSSFLHLQILGILLLVMLASCKTSVPELNSQGKPIPAHLTQPLKFANFTVSDIRSALEASNLMSQKIWVGENGPDAYDIFATNDDAPRIHVETVNQYRAAIKAGYAPYTTFEITMASWFEVPYATLRFMATAKPSLHSYLYNGWLAELPVSVLNGSEDGEQMLKKDAAKKMTLEDCTKGFARRPIRDLKVEDNKMTFSDSDCDYVVVELARGDFDGDGYEDSLIMVSTYYREGSGEYSDFYIVGRTKLKQRQVKILDLGVTK